VVIGAGLYLDDAIYRVVLSSAGADVLQM